MIQRILSITLVLGMVLLTTMAGYATDSPTLNHINTKIASIHSTLDQAQINRNGLIAQLQNNEVHASLLSQSLKTTITNLRQQQTRSANLGQQLQREQTRLQQQQNILKQYVQTAYRLGPQPLLKMLLTDPGSDQLSRMLSYYHYLTKQQVSIIHSISQSIQKINSTQQQLKKSYQALKKLKIQQQTQKKSYQTSSTDRQTLLNKINQRIVTQRQQLSMLQQNKQTLEKTVNTIEHKKLPKIALSKGFKHMQGRLAWPTKGRIDNLFGTKIQQSELTWGGILIKAPMGQPVYAVASGQVVFAKWLQGYGLLLIINHGNGYMTLYGRNQALYNKVGDTIQPGDLIANVGKTGGYSQPALYFAIRRYAKPLNPKKWCHFKTA